MLIWLVLCVAIGYSIISSYQSYEGKLFHPEYVTGDGRQHLFPFYEALYPGRFEGDPAYRSLHTFWPPLHLSLGIFLTHWTKSPILTGNIIMVVQFTLCAIFLPLTVARITHPMIGGLSLLWFLNSKSLIQSMLLGLPRGWVPAYLTIFLFFMVKREHFKILLLLLLGPMVTAIGTLIAGVSYALVLLWNAIQEKEQRPPLVRAIPVGLVVIALLFFFSGRPDGSGDPISFSNGTPPEIFHRGGGRFGIYPFRPVIEEVAQTAFRVFVTKRSVPSSVGRHTLIATIMLAFGAALYVGLRRRAQIIPVEILFFGLAVGLCYLLAREYALQFYFPSRYLGSPSALFFLVAIPCIVWNLPTQIWTDGQKKYWGRYALALTIGALIIVGTHAERRPAGDLFIHRKDPKEAPYAWIQKKLPPEAFLGSHPEYINGIQLFSARRAYSTGETIHPVYTETLKQSEERYLRSLRAFYAPDEATFLRELEGTPIDYFIFDKRFFALDPRTGFIKRPKLYNPFQPVAKQLAAHPPEYFWGGRLFDIKENVDTRYLSVTQNILIVKLRALPTNHLQKM